MPSLKLSLTLAAATLSLAGCVYDYPPVGYVPVGPYDYRAYEPGTRYREPQRPYAYGPAVPPYNQDIYGYGRRHYRPVPESGGGYGVPPGYGMPPYPDERSSGPRDYAPPPEQRSFPPSDVDVPDADRSGPSRSAPPPTRQESPSPSSGEHPTATKTGKPGRVKVPFPPYRELDVSGMASGSLARDPTSGKIFRVP